MSLLSNLFSRRQRLPLEGFIDWHCHILPGVDDGVESLEESLDILDAYEKAGIKEVWLTPHIMEDIPNATNALRNRFDKLVAGYEGDMKLNLAAENMIDNLFIERLEANDVLPIGNGGKMLLVETSYFNQPVALYKTLEKVMSKGFYPLLAHPERYNYINEMSTYKKLHDMGVRFQVNLLSLSGYYGDPVKHKAHDLLKAGYIDRFGSDLHSAEQFDIITSLKLSNEILAVFEASKDKQ